MKGEFLMVNLNTNTSTGENKKEESAYINRVNYRIEVIRRLLLGSTVNRLYYIILVYFMPG